MRTDFYVYEHRQYDDPSKVFYVGKGFGNRVMSIDRNKYWIRVASKHGIIFEIIASGLTEDQAFCFEEYLIKQYKQDGHKLTNLTDGGEGPVGLKWSRWSRIKKSAIARKQFSNIEARRKASENTKKQFSDPEQRRKTSENTKKQFSDPEQRRIQSEIRKLWWVKRKQLNK